MTEEINIGVVGSGCLAVSIAKRLEEISYGNASENALMPLFNIEGFEETNCGSPSAADVALNSSIIILSMDVGDFERRMLDMPALSRQKIVLSLIDGVSMDILNESLDSTNIRAVTSVAYEYGSAISAYAHNNNASEDSIEKAVAVLELGSAGVLGTTEEKLDIISIASSALLAIKLDERAQLIKMLVHHGLEVHAARSVVDGVFSSTERIGAFNGNDAEVLRRMMADNPKAKECVDHLRGSGGIERLERMLFETRHAPVGMSDTMLTSIARHSQQKERRTIR